VAAAVGPDRVYYPAVSSQAFVVALLVAVVDRVAWKYAVAVVLVGAEVAHPHAGPEVLAVRRLRKIGVGHEPGAGRVVARVVIGNVHLTRDRIGRQPVVEAIHAGERLADRAPRRPGGAAVVGDRPIDVRVRPVRREVHPGARDPAGPGTGGSIRVAGRIHQRAAERLGRNPDVDMDSLEGDDGRSAPGRTAVERAVEDDRVLRDIVPGDVHLALRSGGHGRPDGMPLPARAVDASRGAGRPAVARGRHLDAAGARSADRRVPGDVHVVAERAPRVLVGGDH